MFGLGPVELAVIGAIVLLLAGPSFVKRTLKTISETRKEIRQLAKEAELDEPEKKDTKG